MNTGLLRGRMLGHDTDQDMLYVFMTVVSFIALDRLTMRAASSAEHAVDTWSLLRETATTNPVLWLCCALVVAGFVVAPTRMLAEWNHLEHGATLRRFVAPLLGYAAWSYALYDYNIIADQWHTLDRTIIVVLGVAAWWRPVFLGPFVLQARIIVDQIAGPYGNEASANLDNLLLLCLIAVAAAHVLHVVTDESASSAVLLLVAAAVAAHFFIPGRSKIELGWFANNDISDLPFAGHSAGWRASGDGSLARGMSSLLGTIGPLAKAATLVVELGSIVAVLHRRLLCLWLPLTIGFHMMVFASTGFWFVPWILIEVGLLIILRHDETRSWVNKNATPARAALSILLIMAGGVVFHPPGLGWIDSPVSYGYRLQAVDDDGTTYNLAPSDFGLLGADLAFLNLRVHPNDPLSGAYGALANGDNIETLRELSTIAQVRSAERPVPDARLDEQRRLAVEVLQTFLRATHNRLDRIDPFWSAVGPPDRFWTNAPAPRYSFDRPLVSLELFLVRDVHAAQGLLSDSELVLRLTLDAAGREVVEFMDTPES